jgi:DNA-binding CsgD family transcriptional regulator
VSQRIAPGIYLVFESAPPYDHGTFTGAGIRTGRLLGRAPELAVFNEMLRDAAGGQSAARVLRGEAGSGKTALLDELARRAEGFTVLATRGVQAETDIPFAGLSSLLAPVLGRLQEIPSVQSEALEAALGLRAPSVADPFTISAGTLSLLAAAAEDKPVLAIVDDVHWIDMSSTQALVFSGRRLVAEGVVLVFAIRDGVHEIVDSAGFPEIVLGGLPPEAARELLAESSPELADQIVERIIETSGGNPLAMIEIPRLLSEAQQRGQEPLPDPLPVGGALEDAYRSRVGVLPRETRRALLVAAADGTGATGVVTTALRQLDSNPNALEDAEGTGLISVNGEIRFRHPVVRSALYHAATPSERRAAHRAIAAGHSGDPARRAWHLARGALGPDEDIAAAIEAAAKQARRRHAPSASARAWEDAARLTPEPSARSRRLLAAAEDYQLSGQFERAEAVFDDAARGADSPHALAEIWRLRGRIEVFRGAPHQAYAVLVDQANAVANEQPGTSALLLAEAALAAMPAGEAKLAFEAACRALDFAGRSGGPERIPATLAYAQASILVGRAAEASGRLAAVESLLSSDPLAGPLGLQVEIGFRSILCQFDEARTLAERLVATARTRSAPGVLPFPLSTLADIDFRTGRWRLARAEADESYSLARQTGQPLIMPYARIVLARVEAAMGMEDECRRHVAEALAVAETAGADAITFYADSVLGSLALGLGHYEEAVEHGLRVARAEEERGIREPAVLLSSPNLIEGLERLGRRNEAEYALRIFEEQAQATQGIWSRAAAARMRGSASPETDFEKHFDTAFDLYRQTTLPFEEARTHLALGERRRRSGRRSDAREPLRRAIATFDRLGARPWAERARSELRASGEVLRRTAPNDAALTPQELQVALVVARGASNRKAAAELFLSPKTIDFHLSRVYRKLGIHSRSQLASMLAADERPTA